MKTRRQAISEKVFGLLDAISTVNGRSVDFDGKYHFNTGKVESDKSLTFHLRDIKNRHEDQKQYLDFQISIVSRNGDDNYEILNNATMEILYALFNGINSIREIFGNQCRWIPQDQDEEIEFVADVDQAETTIMISLLHWFGDSLYEVDITDYTFAERDKTFITSDGKLFKTSDGKQLMVPRR